MQQLADDGFLDLGAMRLEYRMIGPRPDEAPTLVMLHEGLGCVGLWGDFPDRLATATSAGAGLTRGLVFGEALVFIALLAAGFVYAWRRGVFQWR